jgi:hypothetical protein
MAAGGLSLPTVNAVQAVSGGGFDAFVTRLSPTGQVEYSTYLGGTGEDAAWGVAVNDAYHAFVVGHTQAGITTTPDALQPNPPGGDDGFLVELSDDGTLLEYATYLGGVSGDKALDVALDGQGRRMWRLTARRTSRPAPRLDTIAFSASTLSSRS